ncbi:MAG TPA: formate dehydrogenase subunit gamma [Gallionella sp.]|nr:formate dehydrogenase subunit gamma [Gallionella sp.]
MSLDYDHQQLDFIIAAQQNRPGALLPILHDIQDAFGYIPPDSVARIASALNLSRAEVHGVITYYHHFRTTPPAGHTIQICCAEACQSMGAERLVEHAEQRIAGRKPGEYSLQPVYCLGLCATSPAVMIDEKLHARVTPEKFDALLKNLGGKS